MLRFVPVLWFVVLVGAGVRLAMLRRPPTEAPGWPAVALGATFGGVAALLGADVVVQAVLAGGIGLAMGLLLWRWRRLMDDDRLPPGVGGNRLVGMVGHVTEPIDEADPDRLDADGLRPTDGHATVGQVTVGGEHWRATTRGVRGVSVGSPVVVRAVRGTTLVVEPDVLDGTGPTPGRSTSTTRPVPPQPSSTPTSHSKPGAP